tara:strand:+ start:15572 stop:18838 length:3267 start_codon:yes stop_codon:yes gene_type:complete
MSSMQKKAQQGRERRTAILNRRAAKSAKPKKSKVISGLNDKKRREQRRLKEMKARMENMHKGSAIYAKMKDRYDDLADQYAVNYLGAVPTRNRRAKTTREQQKADARRRIKAATESRTTSKRTKGRFGDYEATGGGNPYRTKDGKLKEGYIVKTSCKSHYATTDGKCHEFKGSGDTDTDTDTDSDDEPAPKIRRLIKLEKDDLRHPNNKHTQLAEQVKLAKKQAEKLKNVVTVEDTDDGRGKGLFALKDLRTGFRIYYYGKFYQDHEQRMGAVPDSDKVVTDKHGNPPWEVDGGNKQVLPYNLAARINHTDDHLANADLGWDHKEQQPYIKINQAGVEAGDEILINYGDAYNMQEVDDEAPDNDDVNEQLTEIGGFVAPNNPGLQQDTAQLQARLDALRGGKKKDLVGGRRDGTSRPLDYEREYNRIPYATLQYMKDLFYNYMGASGGMQDFWKRIQNPLPNDPQRPQIVNVRNQPAAGTQAQYTTAGIQGPRSGNSLAPSWREARAFHAAQTVNQLMRNKPKQSNIVAQTVRDNWLKPLKRLSIDTLVMQGATNQASRRDLDVDNYTHIMVVFDYASHMIWPIRMQAGRNVSQTDTIAAMRTFINARKAEFGNVWPHQTLSIITDRGGEYGDNFRDAVEQALNPAGAANPVDVEFEQAPPGDPNVNAQAENAAKLIRMTLRKQTEVNRAEYDALPNANRTHRAYWARKWATTTRVINERWDNTLKERPINVWRWLKTLDPNVNYLPDPNLTQAQQDQAEQDAQDKLDEVHDNMRGAVDSRRGPSRLKESSFYEPGDLVRRVMGKEKTAMPTNYEKQGPRWTRALYMIVDRHEEPNRPPRYRIKLVSRDGVNNDLGQAGPPWPTVILTAREQRETYRFPTDANGISTNFFRHSDLQKIFRRDLPPTAAGLPAAPPAAQLPAPAAPAAAAPQAAAVPAAAPLPPGPVPAPFPFADGAGTVAVGDTVHVRLVRARPGGTAVQLVGLRPTPAAASRLLPPYEKLSNNIDNIARSAYHKATVQEVQGGMFTKIRVRFDTRTRSTRTDINSIRQNDPAWLQSLHSNNGWLLGTEGDSKVLAGSVVRRDPYSSS